MYHNILFIISYIFHIASFIEDKEKNEIQCNIFNIIINIITITKFKYKRITNKIINNIHYIRNIKINCINIGHYNIIMFIK